MPGKQINQQMPLKTKVANLVTLMINEGLASYEVNAYIDNKQPENTFPRFLIKQTPDSEYGYSISLESEESDAHACLLAIFMKEPRSLSYIAIKLLPLTTPQVHEEHQTELFLFDPNNPLDEKRFNIFHSAIEDLISYNICCQTADALKAYYKDDNKKFEEMSNSLHYAQDEATAIKNNIATIPKEFKTHLSMLEKEAKKLESTAKSCESSRTYYRFLKKFLSVVNYFISTKLIKDKIAHAKVTRKNLSVLKKSHTDASQSIRLFQKKLDLNNAYKKSFNAYKEYKKNHERPR